jgi:oxygen-independent coproporphyrinogen III oxidase
LTEEDRLRREIIERLMCDLEVNLAEVANSRNRRLDDFATELSALDELAEHGMIIRHNGSVSVPQDARPFVRTVCATFDTSSDRQRGIEECKTICLPH